MYTFFLYADRNFFITVVIDETKLHSEHSNYEILINKQCIEISVNSEVLIK